VFTLLSCALKASSLASFAFSCACTNEALLASMLDPKPFIWSFNAEASMFKLAPVSNSMFLICNSKRSVLNHYCICHFKYINI
jgi:hypothetical protein